MKILPILLAVSWEGIELIDFVNNLFFTLVVSILFWYLNRLWYFYRWTVGPWLQFWWVSRIGNMLDVDGMSILWFILLSFPLMLHVQWPWKLKFKYIILSQFSHLPRVITFIKFVMLMGFMAFSFLCLSVSYPLSK